MLFEIAARSLPARSQNVNFAKVYLLVSLDIYFLIENIIIAWDLDEHKLELVSAIALLLFAVIINSSIPYKLSTSIFVTFFTITPYSGSSAI